MPETYTQTEPSETEAFHTPSRQETVGPTVQLLRTHKHLVEKSASVIRQQSTTSNISLTKKKSLTMS